ncbi:hypothetical protein TNCV_5021961 [Trichonephila clavipes]|nr:hypothetical protein TNCV_5021961 [Trichonephila clavipes]
MGGVHLKMIIVIQNDNNFRPSKYRVHESTDGSQLLVNPNVADASGVQLVRDKVRPRNTILQSTQCAVGRFSTAKRHCP